tara:strand:- start:1407 stop:1865 length:459 start_codon:yes stop_codon:yes gene_type:complete
MKTKSKFDNHYVAAWLDEKTCKLLSSAGVRKIPHLTTYFDASGLIHDVVQYDWDGSKDATVTAIRVWIIKGQSVIVAMLDCQWSKEVNSHYERQGLPIEHHEHKPHVTLIKLGKPSDARQFAHLVGKKLTFDRHGSAMIHKPATSLRSVKKA